MEDSLSHIYGSIGTRRRRQDRMVKSETAIVAGIAKATLPPNPKLKWDEWTGDYDLIRDLIAQTYPDKFADFNDRLFQPGGFYKGNPARERIWKTESGKAQFTAPTTLSALGEDAGGQRGHDADHPAVERPVQHHDLWLLRPVARAGGQSGNRADQPRRDGAASGSKRVRKSALSVRWTTASRAAWTGLTVTPYDLPAGCIAGYYPELNPLVPLGYHEKNSQTPAYKGTPVEIVS